MAYNYPMKIKSLTVSRDREESGIDGDVLAVNIIKEWWSYEKTCVDNFSFTDGCYLWEANKWTEF